MSINGNESVTRSRVFSSQEFMNFLNKQAGDISKLEVTTKNGDRISASFSGFEPSTGRNEVFKSLDAMKVFLSEDSTGKAAPPVGLTVSKQSNGGNGGATSDFFTSKDWSLEYGENHVDVTYNKTFDHSTARQPKSSAPSPSDSASLPPKKRSGRTDWNAIYQTALSPLVEAASRAQPHPLECETRESPLSSTNVDADSKTTYGEKKRKPRKIVPDTKEFVEYTDKDVLFGRGGRSNHHPGNKLYRELVTEKQDFYRGCDKNEKTQVAQSIVDRVQKEFGGRFLERDGPSGLYYIVPNLMARRKVGQALRENNTEEARATKRERYGQGKPKKSSDASSVGSSATSSKDPTSSPPRSHPLGTTSQYSRNYI